MEPVVELIKKIAGKMSLVAQVGKVTAVDKDNYTCDIEFEDGVTAPILGCRLNAVVNKDTACINVIPVKDSYVLVVNVDGSDSDVYVLGYSDVETIFLKIDKTTVKIDKEGVVINEGKNKGLVKIKELTDKLNALKDSVNAIASTFNSHTHPYVDSVAGNVTTSASTSQAQKADPFEQVDYENDKVTH